ncbi:LysR family transcriptional regulator [Nocardia sp. JMUB6875]|uniref:LysR family transcriptional regulator n=1 Tax=Nocardia sp. JMUB6875 TaxID=3158170 RepID=UPI0032E56DCF
MEWHIDPMELRQLEYFVAVAQELSFSRGAARVHVVQSAVSSGIAKLERELGVQLFDRTPPAVVLTPAGTALLAEANATLDAAQRAREVTAQFTTNPSGTVELHIHEGCSRILDLPAFITRFRDEHPLIRVRVKTGLSVSIARAIAEKSVEVGLIAPPPQPPPGIRLRNIHHEPLVLVCAPDHPLASRQQVAVADLAGQTLILHDPESALRQIVDLALDTAGIRPTDPYEVDSLSTTMDLARTGAGVTLLPAVAAAWHPDLTTIAVTPPLHWDIALATPDGRLSPPAAALAKALATLDLDGPNLDAPQSILIA